MRTTNLLCALRTTCLAIAVAAALPAAHAADVPDRVGAELFDRLGDDASATGATSSPANGDSAETRSAEVVFSSIPDNAEQQLEATGAQVSVFSERFERATVEITNRQQAEAIANLSFVRFIRSSPVGMTNAGTTGERPNEALRHAELLDDDNGTVGDGEGTRVGIISDSFTKTDGTYDSETTTGTDDGGGTPKDETREVAGLKNQLSGDLPDVVEIRDDSAGFVIDEGAAMAEIVHDTAPGAAISFHQGIATPTEMAEAYIDLCKSRASGGAGADVVVDDLYFYRELVFQPGIINQAMTEDCIANGVPVVTAAGNLDDKGIRQNYTDVAPNTDDPGYGDGSTERWPDNGADFHQWESGDEYVRITLQDGQSIEVVLQWNQPALSLPDNDANGPQIDLDLLIYESPSTDSTPTITGSDQMANDATDGFDPMEVRNITNNSGGEKDYYVAVNHFEGSKDALPQDSTKSLELSLMFFPWGDGDVDREIVADDPASTGAVYGHGNAEGAISVASLWWNETTTFDITQGQTTNRDVAPYSSTGGEVALPFAADGTVQDKTVSGPDIAAVDGMNTTFFGSAPQTNQDGESDGYPNFYGTSAAAPVIAGHIASIQGMTQQERSIDDLRYVLTENAVDVTGAKAETGPDMATGAGLYRSDRGAQTLLPVATVETSATGNIAPGDTVDLTAEPAGGSMPYTYSWRQVSGPDALSDPGDDNQATASFEEAGTYAFAVDVTESSGRTFTVTTERTVEVAETSGDDGTDEGSDDGPGGDSGGDDGGSTGGGGGGSDGGGGGGSLGALPLALLLGGGLVRVAVRRTATVGLAASCAVTVSACAGGTSTATSSGAAGIDDTSPDSAVESASAEPAVVGSCIRGAINAGDEQAWKTLIRGYGGTADEDGTRVVAHVRSGAASEWDDVVAALEDLDGVEVRKPSERWERVEVQVGSVEAIENLRAVPSIRSVTCSRQGDTH